jgi:hypothetical protein
MKELDIDVLHIKPTFEVVDIASIPFAVACDVQSGSKISEAPLMYIRYVFPIWITVLMRFVVDENGWIC